MNKLILMCTLMCTFIAFTACSNDDESQFDSVLVENGKILASSEFQPYFCKLGDIPLNVKTTASKKELQLFKTLSKRFYIDYSFTNTAYYQKNKEEVLSQLASIQNITFETDDVYISITTPNGQMLLNGSETETNNPENGGRPIVKSDSYTAYYDMTTQLALYIYVDYTITQPYKICNFRWNVSPGRGRFASQPSTSIINTGSTHAVKTVAIGTITLGRFSDFVNFTHLELLPK